MSEFFRFPHTPHLAWLGAGSPRNDKVLGVSEAHSLLAQDVVVEEKVDGANLGFSVDSKGQLCVQNRGKYLEIEALAGQFKPLGRWLSTRRERLVEALTSGLILFGEWCYAVHTVRYDRLPDWFLAFDVYDAQRGTFWSSVRRNRLALEIGIKCVPCLGQGRFDIRGLTTLLGQSKLTGGPPEGIYIRCETQEILLQRAKLVRPEFVQAIGTHWSRRELVANGLATDDVGGGRRG